MVLGNPGKPSSPAMANAQHGRFVSNHFHNTPKWLWINTVFSLFAIGMVGAQAFVPSVPLSPYLQFKPMARSSNDHQIQGTCSAPCSNDTCHFQISIAGPHHVPTCTLPIGQCYSTADCPRLLPNCSDMIMHIDHAYRTAHMTFRASSIKNIPVSQQNVICTMNNASTSKPFVLHDIMTTTLNPNACVTIPETEGIIYLGQNNFTSCLKNNPEAHLSLVESINFLKLPEDERMQYPLFSEQRPFSGIFNTWPYSIDHFTLNKNDTVALFSAMANSRISIHFTDANVSGKYQVALLANTLYESNIINLTVDNAHFSTHDSEQNTYTGIIASRAVSSNHAISLQAGSLNLTTTLSPSFFGIIAATGLSYGNITAKINRFYGKAGANSVASVGIGISLFSFCNLNIMIDDMTLETTGTGSIIGAGVGHTQASQYNIMLQTHKTFLTTSEKNTTCALAVGHSTQSQHNITVIIKDQASLLAQGPYSYISSGIGQSIKDAENKIMIYANDLEMIALGNHSSSGVGIGKMSQSEKQQITIQESQIKITSSHDAAVGVGTIDLPSSGTIIISNTHATIFGSPYHTGVGIGVIFNTSNTTHHWTTFLLSGNGTTNNGHLIQNSTLCIGSFVDQSSVVFDTDTVGCKQATIIKSIVPIDWRHGHSIIKENFCNHNSVTSCHFPNERFLALIGEPGITDTFFLISQQTYPSHTALTDSGAIRISQLVLNAQGLPYVNTTFALNGLRLFQTIAPTTYSKKLLIAVSINDFFIQIAYDIGHGNLEIASFFINAIEDSSYDATTQYFPKNSVPIQFDGAGLWLQQKDNMLYYNQNIQKINFTLAGTTPKKVVGTTYAGHYIYTVSTSHTDIVAERYFTQNTTIDSSWKRYIHNRSELHSPLRLYVSGDVHEPKLTLLKIAEWINKQEDPNCIMTVQLPQIGGFSQWHYRTSLLATNNCSKTFPHSEIPYTILEPAQNTTTPATHSTENPEKNREHIIWISIGVFSGGLSIIICSFSSSYLIQFCCKQIKQFSYRKIP